MNLKLEIIQKEEDISSNCCNFKHLKLLEEKEQINIFSGNTERIYNYFSKEFEELISKLIKICKKKLYKKLDGLNNRTNNTNTKSIIITEYINELVELKLVM